MNLANYQQSNPQSLVELIHVLTHSAFVHEYAVHNLDQCTVYSERASLLNNMEKSKVNYGKARKELLKMDPQRLLVVEESIKNQKLNLFPCETYQ